MTAVRKLPANLSDERMPPGSKRNAGAALFRGRFHQCKSAIDHFNPAPIAATHVQGMVSSNAVTALLLSIPTEAAGEASQARQWLPAMLMSVGIVIILVLWSMSIRNRSTRKHAEFATPREQIERIKAGHRTREIEGALTAEFVTSATEIAARLENKAERLEQLIEQADERLMRLREAMGMTESEPTHEGATAAMQPESDRSRATDAPPHRPEPADPLALAVIELSDAGHSPVEIAQQLDEQIGKVELILALRRP